MIWIIGIFLYCGLLAVVLAFNYGAHRLGRDEMRIGSSP